MPNPTYGLSGWNWRELADGATLLLSNQQLAQSQAALASGYLVQLANSQAAYLQEPNVVPILPTVRRYSIEDMATMKNPPIAHLLRLFVAAMRKPLSDDRRAIAHRDILLLIRENVDNYFLFAQGEPNYEGRVSFYQRLVDWLNKQGLKEDLVTCKGCHTVVLVSARNHVPLWDAWKIVKPNATVAGFVCGRCEAHMVASQTYFRINDMDRALSETAEQIEGAILNYGFDATRVTAPIIGADEHDPMLVGVELECIVRSDHVDRRWGANAVARELRGKAPWLITKSDGSIGGPGFEIVTAPMSLKAHQTLWSALFEDGIMAKVRSHESCGLHVHLSKSSMTALDLGKMMVFCNHAANVPLIQAVAGRNANTYARFTGETTVSRGAFLRTDKYSVLNTGKAATVELRIGASTTVKQELLGRIEFAHAIWDFAHNTSADRRKLTAAAFVEFVLQHQTVYLFLARHLVKLIGMGNAAGLGALAAELERRKVPLTIKELPAYPVTVQLAA